MISKKPSSPFFTHGDLIDEQEIKHFLKYQRPIITDDLHCDYEIRDLLLDLRSFFSEGNKIY